tara:strand:+ start:5867 stop:6145 length:279 start_codon:yes stop_codon:yes gene_type:complete
MLYRESDNTAYPYHEALATMYPEMVKMSRAEALALVNPDAKPVAKKPVAKKKKAAAKPAIPAPASAEAESASDDADSLDELLAGIDSGKTDD